MHDMLLKSLINRYHQMVKENNQHRYNSYILNTVNQFDTRDNYPTWVLL